MDVNLTEGNDTYTQPVDRKDSGDNIFGKGGNDVIKAYQGNVIGGPGSDTIELIVVPGEPWRGIIAAYWDGAPGAVVVDLQAGWAEDGWGTRDTLVGVRDVAGNWTSNTFYGSNEDNTFFLGGGKNVVDGRVGSDVAFLPWLNGVQPTLSQFQIKVSIDGLTAVITMPGNTNFQATLTNVETIAIGGVIEERRALADFIKPEDLAIDGLVAGASNRWNVSKALGTAVEVTYSFVKSAPASGIGTSGFHAFTTAEQATVKAILTSLSLVTGLTFKEVAEAGAQHGSMRFGASQQTSTKGVTYLPGENGDAAGDVWMDIDSLTNLAAGSEGYAALLHEIGHALGLRHPRNVDAGDHYAQQFRSDYDLTSLTVMSQTASPDGLFPSTWGALDIAALRYLYGSKSVNTGNDTYKIDGIQFLSETVLIDDGGIDTVDASLARTGAALDLTPGHLSSVGVTGTGVGATNNLSLALGSFIENAIGSDFDDVIVGNDLANVITGGKGNDWIDGGKGIDIAVFAGLRSEYLISTGFGKTFISGRDGASGFDTLLGIETIKFYDLSVTLGTSAFGADIVIDVDQDSKVAGQLPDPSDETRDLVSYTIKTMPANGSLTLSKTGDFVYTPKPFFGAADSFTYTLSDQKSGSNVYTAFIQVRAQSTVVSGGDGDDTIIGSAGNDSITTFAGNDLITGSLGNDLVDGGTGLDTIVYLSKHTDFTITRTPSGNISVQKSSAQGTDTLTNIERVAFTDTSLAFDITSTAGQAYRLYQAAFDRKPDFTGLGYWIKEMDNGSSLTTVAAGFFQSPEFQKLYGSNPNTTTLITNFYQNVLHRAPDQAGLDYWAAELNAGKITPAGALASFCESTENQALVIGAIQNGIEYTPWLG